MTGIDMGNEGDRKVIQLKIFFLPFAGEYGKIRGVGRGERSTLPRERGEEKWKK
jgi:hypothetical protein